MRLSPGNEWPIARTLEPTFKSPKTSYGVYQIGDV